MGAGPPIYLSVCLFVCLSVCLNNLCTVMHRPKHPGRCMHTQVHPHALSAHTSPKHICIRYANGMHICIWYANGMHQHIHKYARGPPTHTYSPQVPPPHAQRTQLTPKHACTRCANRRLKPPEKSQIPSGRLRWPIYKIVTSPRFDVLMMLTILANVGVMMSDHYGETEVRTNALIIYFIYFTPSEYEGTKGTMGAMGTMDYGTMGLWELWTMGRRRCVSTPSHAVNRNTHTVYRCVYYGETEVRTNALTHQFYSQ